MPIKKRKQPKKGAKSIGKDRDLYIPKENQIICVAGKKCGSSGVSARPQINLLCPDGKARKGYVRGKLRKKIWINEGTVVVCEFSGENKDVSCEIFYVYKPHEISKLSALGYLSFIDNKVETKMVEEDDFTTQKMYNNLKQPSRDFPNYESDDEEGEQVDLQPEEKDVFGNTIVKLKKESEEDTDEELVELEESDEESEEDSEEDSEEESEEEL